MRPKILTTIYPIHTASFRPASPASAGRSHFVWAVLLAPVLLLASASFAQVRAPRYQSPIEAPTPQLTLPTPPAITPNGAVLEDVIVRVNDQIIDRSDIERQEAHLAEEAQQANLTSAEVAARQKDMLRDMIDEQLLLSRGKELDVNVDAEVVRQLDEIRKQNHLDSMEALEKAVRQSGISYEDFKANIKNSIIRQTVVRDEVGRNLRRPTAKEEQAFYDAHQQDFQMPEQVRLSEILIPTPDNATDAQVAQAQAKAEEVAAQLKTGAAFDALAKKYSGGQTADKGGDLGLFKRGALAKVLEDQTFSLQPGQFTAPIRTRQGFVVLKVTEHQAAGLQPLKDVEEQIQEGMYTEQMQPALRKYLTGLREKAYIDIAPGFTDTGASPRETRPVYAASTPPPTKKVSVQKQRLLANRAAVAAAAPDAKAAPAAGATVASSSTSATSAKAVSTTATKKRKKIRREKVRFGQAPRNALPASPEETLTAGADQGAGATSNILPAPGAAIAPIDSTNNLASTDTDAGPLAAKPVATGKTRYSDRAPFEAAQKAAAKQSRVKQKTVAAPVAMSLEEKEAQATQTAPLGLSGDTATKKKNKRVKGAKKERLQDQPPAPAAAKPEATPLPPKSIRDNGEPVVSPPPSSDTTTLPPVTAPVPGSSVNTTPSVPTPDGVPPPASVMPPN